MTEIEFNCGQQLNERRLRHQALRDCLPVKVGGVLFFVDGDCHVPMKLGLAMTVGRGIVLYSGHL